MVSFSPRVDSASSSVLRTLDAGALTLGAGRGRRLRVPPHTPNTRTGPGRHSPGPSRIGGAGFSTVLAGAHARRTIGSQDGPAARHGLSFVGLLVAVFTLVFAVACGGDDNGGNTGAPSADAPQTVRLQLDWTPNTNHIGIYVAFANGWYREAGIELDILPYGDTNPDTIVANGQADVAISFPANVIFSRAAGLELTSIASVLQSNPTELTVLADSDIERPRDFDGRTYAGFGLPYEAPQIRFVVMADGGSGNFDVATLDTYAYEALYNGRADFTEMFMTWEGIEADLRGIDIRSFKYSDYGMPDFPGVVLVARTQVVQAGSPRLTTFLEVTRRGYEFAAQNPDEASRIFLEHLPDAFPEPELVRRSTQALASFFVVPGRRWGVQDADDWRAYVHFFVEQDIVVDSDDRVIESVEDLPGGELFSNSLLPDE